MRIITSEEFYNSLNQSPDGAIYLNLIEEYLGDPIKAEKGHEFHHIHPKSLGGSDTASNIVRLPIYEHCIAHLCLAKIFPCPETYYVLNKLSGKRFERFSEIERITLEEVYQWSKVRSALRDCLKGSRCSIYKDGGEKRKVLKSELDEWLGRGYKLGIPEEDKEKNRKRNVGRVVIHNPIFQKNRMVFESELEHYLQEGWQLGRVEVRKGSFKGRIPIHEPNTDEERHVYPCELEHYLSLGWIKGNSIRSQNSRSRVMKGRIRIYKGDLGKMVYEHELQSYIEDGWQRGRSESYKARLRLARKQKRVP